MKKNILYAIGFTSLLITSSCSRDQELSTMNPDQSSTELRASSATDLSGTGMPGIMYVRLSDNAVDKLDIDTSGKVSMRSVSSTMSTTLSTLGATNVERLFTPDPRFEERMHKAGLDEWYVVRFDPTKNLEEAITLMSKVQDVELVEKSYATEMIDTKYTAINNDALPTAKAMPFNDPQLIKQWHYDNQGLYPKSVAGADINLFEAWKTTVGDPKVIVAVVDGGIDYTHEDLKDNMWINQKELNGKAGVDDDDNGYVDDIYGFNFIHQNGSIYPDVSSHGTHVAGTIAARNNNGIGVCGIAGGDATKAEATGVRLMTCQKFGKKNEAGEAANAYVYSANNGAVISQNSWGYTYPGPINLPEHIRVAIDYFTDYAGCDKDGNQLANSPMKGGLVIFAAGNDDKDYVSWPGAYPRVVGVSAMAPNWKKAWYTNRGDWVDIMAPGGDQYFPQGEVLSTLAPSITGGKGYGYMQGTSMACPHVSGIAALVVSKFGGKGFTNEMLRKRILGALRPMNIDEQNVGFEGRLGVGYIDAGAAFAENKNKKPQQVAGMTAEASYVNIKLKWKTVADEDDVTAAIYNIYISDQPLNENNYKSVAPIKINGFGFKVGTELGYEFTSLKQDTHYYFGIEAVDRWGLTSKPAFAQFKTLKNNPPIILGFPQKPIRVSGANIARFQLNVSDPDKHHIIINVEGEDRGVSYSIENNKINFSIRAIAPVGKYTIKVIARDEIGAEIVAEVPFEVFTYNPPRLLGNIKPMIVGTQQKTKVLDLVPLFSHESDQKLQFKASSANGSVASVAVSEDGKLLLTAHQNGTTNIKVTATDGVSDPVETSFEVRVVPNSDDAVYVVYPIPVVKQLNAVVNPDIKRANFVVVSSMGQEVFNRSYDINGMNLVTLSLSKLVPGSYTLIVTSEKATYKKNFVKL
ncbi:S8 family serine peptidase [Porphyromonas pogonae]|uniref:S8 family serine peptidase n=1 Tax=Porphyromonas pogonae TaxID=867595 RepID=UPI002E77F5E6|nr:S8 family serine peptidase [Porphyromonas pogonae]